MPQSAPERERLWPDDAESVCLGKLHVGAPKVGHGRHRYCSLSPKALNRRASQARPSPRVASEIVNAHDLPVAFIAQRFEEGQVDRVRDWSNRTVGEDRIEHPGMRRAEAPLAISAGRRVVW